MKIIEILKKDPQKILPLLKGSFFRVKAFFIAKDKSIHIKIARWLMGVVLGAGFLLMALDMNFLWLFGKSPSIKEIMHPQPNIASEVYSEDGVLLGKYYYENRVPVAYSQISPLLIRTLVATEDERFYSHLGIDIYGSISAMADVFRGNPRGASTITQQLVKNLYKTRAKNNCGLLGKIPFVKVVIVKVKEMFNAFKLEMLFDKNDIVTLYLNTVDFGNNTFGIKTAAKAYFNTSPKELKPEQCALLIGMLKATTTYNPVLHKKRSRERRNIVLCQMKTHGIITSKLYDSLVKKPVSLKLQFEKVNDGSAFYFRQSLVEHLKPWLKNKNYDLYTDGLKIYTTVNYSMQQYAENAVAKNMKRLQRVFDEHWAGQNPWVDSRNKEIPGFVDMIMRQSWDYKKLVNQFNDNIDSINFYADKKEKRVLFSWNGPVDTVISLRAAVDYNMHFLNTGFVAMDPQNGEVKAWVGGINFDYFKFDHVKQSKRQPGSTFKAFVYTAAIDNGFDPCDSITDRPVIIKYNENGVKKSWAPHNADWTFSEQKITLKYAFARSLNSATVQIADKIGWRKVIEYARKMGIESPIDTVPSICLGVSDVSLLELVTAYCPVANGGDHVTPLLVTKITDRFGKTLVEFHSRKEKVLSDETVFLMQQLFLGTMTEPMGTTQALFQYDLFRYNTDIGGKTGTSSNHSDGWFVGITPRLVAGAWVGGEERCIHFKTSALGEGCKTALPIFGSFMEKVLPDTSLSYLRGHFKKPKEKSQREYSCVTKYVPLDSSAAVLKNEEEISE
jgi:penicillin-binding protein 1A